MKLFHLKKNRFTRDIDVVDNHLPQMIRAWLVMATSVRTISICISRTLFSLIEFCLKKDHWHYSSDQYVDAYFYGSHYPTLCCVLLHSTFLCSYLKAAKANRISYQVAYIFSLWRDDKWADYD